MAGQLPTDPREVKLPVWAQELLQATRRRAAEAEQKWDDFVGEQAAVNEATNTYVDRDLGLIGEQPRRFALPLGQRIYFDLDGEELCVNADRSGLAARLRISSEGTREMTVTPHASNVVFVGIR